MEAIWEVFKSPQDRFSWSKHIEYARKAPDLSVTLRNQFAKAIAFLQGELGDNFLAVSRRSNRNHPFIRLMLEKSRWRAMQTIRIVRTLRKLKKNEALCNYRKLKIKFQSMHDCNTEALPFIDIAAMLQQAGFDISFLDELQGQTNPDILARYPGSQHEIYIEVSKLGESLERDLSAENYKELYAAFNYEKYTLPYSFKQLMPIGNVEMPAVLEKIRNTLEQAVLQKAFLHYTDDKIRVGVAHADSYEKLMNWIETNDYRKGPLGLDLNFDETSRIANYKIKEEASQIPAASSGVIYIPVNTLYFWKFDMEDAAHLFQHKMKEFPNLLGIVLYGYLNYEAKPCEFHIDGNFYGIKPIFENIRRHLLYVHNPSYSGGLPKHIISTLYNSLM